MEKDEEYELEEEMMNAGFNPSIPEDVEEFNIWVTEYLTNQMKNILKGEKRG